MQKSPTSRTEKILAIIALGLLAVSVTAQYTSLFLFLGASGNSLLKLMLIPAILIILSILGRKGY